MFCILLKELQVYKTKSLKKNYNYDLLITITKDYIDLNDLVYWLTVCVLRTARLTR